MADTIIVILGRMCIFMLLGTILLFSAIRNRGFTNIPLLCGCGLFFLYACYIFSGITFGNGLSLGAEFLFAVLVATLAMGFTLGNRISKKRISLLCKFAMRRIMPSTILPVSNLFVLVTGFIFVFYINLLTNWNPLLLFTQATELKHYRLNLIFGQKDFLLFFLESILIALLSIGLSWSIVGHKDNKSSDVSLSIFLLLILLQVISTGARSPLIGFSLLLIVSLYEGQKSSLRAKLMLRSIKRYMPIVLLFGILFMGWATSSRIEFEGLAISVFKSYFDIIDFGLSAALFQGDSGVSFLLGTIVVYAADTFNNFVLRFQMASAITHSFGYQFLFPYVSFLEPLTRHFTDVISAWREMSSHNNEILTNIADSATQWSTVFGDFLWDFGIAGAIVIIFLISVILGYVIGSANRHPSTANTILKVYLVSLLIMPLVNPFSSLQFHFICIFLLAFNKIFRPRRSRLINTTHIHSTVRNAGYSV